MNIRKKMLISTLITALSLVLLLLAEASQEFAQWYSENCYAAIVASFGKFYGIFPFSVSELMLYIAGIGMTVALIRFLKNRGIRKSDANSILKYAANVCLLLSCLFFIFTISCGINYKRPSFSERTGLITADYSLAELKELCSLLTEEVNRLSTAVARNEQGLAIPKNNIRKNSVAAMHALGEDYSDLAGYYPLPKGLLLPQILSFQNLSGIYSPFTIEANYNSGMVPYNIPFTACHELSHLKGFMQEEEANFIAYLACRKSDDPFMKYSGSLLGWIYSTNALHQADSAAYTAFSQQLSETVHMDLLANKQYWSAFDGPISDMTDKVNDTYLKANGQSDGVKSYDRMVDLMIAYERKQALSY